MSEGCSQSPEADAQKLQAAMSKVRHKLLVLSGKGGVGKSTVAVNLANELAASGKRVGLLDVDIHGPSIPRLTGLLGQQTTVDADGIAPLPVTENLKVMSIAFLLTDDRQAVIWRGPMKHSVIRQLLAETNWGELDYLIIDAPPGTGDEPLAVAELVGENASAVIVTTPQMLATGDVRRCITFCGEVSLPIQGIIENMAGLVCPHCQTHINLFGRDGGKELAKDSNLPLLGSIPLDPAISHGGDRGMALADTPANDLSHQAFHHIVTTLLEKTSAVNLPETKGVNIMKIAIPLADGKLCMHFGHCEQFALVDVDAAGEICGKTLLTPPPHEPGVLPQWLSEKGATQIIAGGMGQRAHGLFSQHGIEVLVGAPAETPETLVAAYLKGELKTGENVCDH